MKLPKSQKGFAPVFLLLGFAILIFVSVGGMYLYNQTKTSNNPSYQNVAPIASDSSAPGTSAPITSEENFLKAYKAKYPKPAEQKVSAIEEKELSDAFLASGKAMTVKGQTTDPAQFSVRHYYGDVAEGGITWCNPDKEGSCGGGAAWVMNKDSKGKWIVITIGQEASRCKDLQPFMEILNDWQGLCFTDDPDKGSRLIDGKHPQESYNSY